MEFAAEILSERHRAGGPVRQQLDDGQIRSAQSAVAEEVAGGRHQAAQLLAADHAGLPEGDQGIVRRDLSDQSELQEGAGLDEQLHDQRIPVVPGRRAWLRQLHGAQSAELISITADRHHKRKPRSESPGVFCFEDATCRYCFGPPKSSGGSSICGTSILTLERSTSSGLSSSAVTTTGKAITIATMIACSPIKGRAPQ